MPASADDAATATPSTGKVARTNIAGHSPTPIPAPLAILLDDPATSALVVDFDGTIAEIVDDPSLATPLLGAVQALSETANVLGMVAVLSGRPVGFLAERLQPLDKKVRLVGLYGMEHHSPDGPEPHAHAGAGSIGTETARALQEAREAAAAIVAAARQAAPPGIRVEDKGLSVALHWREHPELATWARDFAAVQAHHHRLLVAEAKMAVELLPPNAVGKGGALASLLEQMDPPCRAVCYAGDDVGDLDAFLALDRLAGEGKSVVKVAVASPEAPSALLEAADVVLASPHELVQVLHDLGQAASR
jgi:trehalose 6-phosphate phosphatase